MTENSVSGCSYKTVQMSVSRHPPTHPPTRPPFYTYNQTSGSHNSRRNSTSWSSLPLVSGISAFATPPTLLLLQLTPLPGPRPSVLAHLSPLATTCFQVDTCLQHQHTVSQGADRLLQMHQTSGSRTQQTNHCRTAGGVPLLLCFLNVFHSNDSNSVTNRKTALRERTSFPPHIW